jgi:pimeloyl-ACP methyl ester carboxylesterase
MDARATLRTAHDLLEAMGIEAFAERARRELDATGETARKRSVATRHALTPRGPDRIWPAMAVERGDRQPVLHQRAHGEVHLATSSPSWTQLRAELDGPCPATRPGPDRSSSQGSRLTPVGQVVAGHLDLMDGCERARLPTTLGGPPRLTMPVLAIGGAASWGEHVGDAMKLAADDVQSVVIPGAGHWVAETAAEEMLAALTAFLAPYRD